MPSNAPTRTPTALRPTGATRCASTVGRRPGSRSTPSRARRPAGWRPTCRALADGPARQPRWEARPRRREVAGPFHLGDLVFRQVLHQLLSRGGDAGRLSLRPLLRLAGHVDLEQVGLRDLRDGRAGRSAALSSPTISAARRNTSSVCMSRSAVCPLFSKFWPSDESERTRTSRVALYDGYDVAARPSSPPSSAADTATGHHRRAAKANVVTLIRRPAASPGACRYMSYPPTWSRA